jgi:glutathione-specific gamma-glutamylcyclotransferase
MQATSCDEPLYADWVFAYGSLIWNPDFDYSESTRARVYGYHRAFCVRSTLYRGTPEKPGVVLGLDIGGSVEGLVFKIAPGHHREAIDRLYAREMVQDIYVAKLLNTRLCDGRQVRALTFVANRTHAGYAALSEPEIVERLAGCKGARGPNCEYAINTLESLNQLGVHDAGLARVVSTLQNNRKTTALA